MRVKINDVTPTSSVEEKLLGITLDSELKFEKHITDICNKASQKIHVLSRISSYISLNKRRLLMKTFVESQFNYCPLIWIFHSRRLNSKDASFSVQHRNIQTLVIDKHIQYKNI